MPNKPNLFLIGASKGDSHYFLEKHPDMYMSLENKFFKKSYIRKVMPILARERNI
jgi:hypothetical protein